MSSGDYISREAAVEIALTYHEAHDITLVPGPYKDGFECGANLREQDITIGLLTLLADDVRPVVRGKWENAIQSCGDSPHIKCSVCGTYFWQYFRQFNWCPICGAKMGGADNA